MRGQRLESVTIHQLTSGEAKEDMEQRLSADTGEMGAGVIALAMDLETKELQTLWNNAKLQDEKDQDWTKEPNWEGINKQRMTYLMHGCLAWVPQAWYPDGIRQAQKTIGWASCRLSKV